MFSNEVIVQYFAKLTDSISLIDYLEFMDDIRFYKKPKSMG